MRTPATTSLFRGLIALGLVGALTTGLVLSPVGAAFKPTKRKVRQIATKIVAQRLACPSGTIPLAGSCFEPTPRPQAFFGEASIACAAVGGRLPTVSELLAFEAAGHELETFGFGEGTSDLHREGADEKWWSVENGGAFGPTDLTNKRAFRCVIG